MPSPTASDTAGGALRTDAWLSEVLEQPVYAVDAKWSPAELPAGAFAFARVPVADVTRVRELTRRGFSVVDVGVTLRHEREEPRGGGGQVEVVEAAADHADRLLAIAGSCFRYSRFHLDPSIPDELADRVKREWVRSYVEGRRGSALLAAVAGGRPLGFLAVLGAGDACVIDLIGVDAAEQRRGVGGALVSAFVDRYASAAPALQVGTQIANVPSLRLYERHGFRVESAAYVLHLHTG